MRRNIPEQSSFGRAEMDQVGLYRSEYPPQSPYIAKIGKRVGLPIQGNVDDLRSFFARYPLPRARCAHACHCVSCSPQLKDMPTQEDEGHRRRPNEHDVLRAHIYRRLNAASPGDNALRPEKYLCFESSLIVLQLP
jgi:hypothetical protein